MKNKLRLLIAALLLLLFPGINFAQAPVLGSVANFVLFSNNGAITNSGSSQITGDIGTNNGANTGFGNVNGTVNSANVATAQASADLATAYNQLNQTPATATLSNILGNGDTLTAGVYSIGIASVMSGTLVLNGNGNQEAVFIFKIQGPLSTSSNTKVKLINGAKAGNVFWKVEGLVSIASGTTIRGTIIANNAPINMNTGDTLEGRALSTTDAVIVNGTVAFIPLGCGRPSLIGPIAPNLAYAATYALFTADGMASNTGITHINGGDVGTNNGTATGFDSALVTGRIHAAPDSSTSRADTDLVNTYSYLNLLAEDIELLHPEQLGNNLVLTPHTYVLNAATTLTDTLYLNAQGNPAAIFVIKINGSLTTTAKSRVLLINGTQARNVYWRIDGATIINDSSIFHGTLLVNNGTLRSGSLLTGRMLSIIGPLTTNNATINSAGAAIPLPDLIISTTTNAEGTYNNVTVTGTGNGTLTGNLVVMGSMLMQTGGRMSTGGNIIQGPNNFIMNAGTALSIHSPYGITAYAKSGDIQVSGSRTFNPVAAYSYAGNSIQVTGNALPATVDSLRISNPNGVSLSAPQSVSHGLTLGNGNLAIGNYDLLIAPAANITGAAVSGYIATNDSAKVSGTVKRTVVSAGPAVLFPVGSARFKGSYTPATITMPSGTTDVISVSVFRGVMTSGLTGSAVASHVVNRSWIISEAVIGGSNVTVQLQWNDTMEQPSFIRTKTGIAHHNGTSWNAPLPNAYVAASGVNPYTTSRSGITSFSVFIVADSTTNATLPVKLLTFTGTRADADVVLSWKTASEINNNYFNIERSEDGKSFVRIGTLQGAGNSLTQVNYAFTDRNIANNAGAVLYYRLRQVDFDGKISTYDPIAIRLTQADEAFVVATYPNPVTNTVQLRFMNTQPGSVLHVAIYDMQGNVVTETEMTPEAGMNVISIDNLDALKGGLYFMNAALNGNIYRQKLVKSGM